MKKLLISIVALFFIIVSTQAQTRRMTNVFASKTYTSQNQNETIQPLLLEAHRKFRKTDFEGVLMILDKAVSQNPNSAEALAERARYKKIIGMDTEAQADLRRANQINPFAASIYGYYGNLGLLKVLMVMPESAEQTLSEYQKLNPYYQALDQELLVAEAEKEAIGNIEDILMAIENDKLSTAENGINEMFSRNPNSATAFDLQGLVLRKKGDYLAAKTAFTRSIELDENFAIGWYNLGQVERNLGNFKAAENHLNKAIFLQKNLTKAYFERAMLKKQIGKQEEAIKDYNMIIELEGDSYMEALVNRGLTKKMMGDFAGALTDLDKVVEDFPDKSDLRENRGNLNLLLGLPRQAIEDYSKAIQLDAENAEAFYHRAIAFLILYDKISACEDFEKSIELGHKQAAELKKYFCLW